MSNLVHRIRPSVADALAALPLVLGTLLGLSGCGGPPEAAKQPEPVKVVWSSDDGTEAADEAPAKASDAPATGSNEIDLDALAAEKAEKKPAHKGKAKEEKAKEKAHEEPPATSPPPAPEAETEAAAEPPVAEPPPAAEPPAPVPLGKEMRAAVKTKDQEPPPKKSAKKKAPAEPSSAAATYTGPSPCKAEHFSVPRVKEACSTGGRNAAKAVMKDAVGKALAAGATLKCGDCHAEQKDYTLKKDAVAKLKKWLGP